MDNHRGRLRDRLLGNRLYREGRPYASISFYNVHVRIGWRQAHAAEQQAREAIRRRTEPEPVVDIGKLELMRRGGGNRSGTGGKKGTMSR